MQLKKSLVSVVSFILCLAGYFFIFQTCFASLVPKKAGKIGADSAPIPIPGKTGSSTTRSADFSIDSAKARRANARRRQQERRLAEKRESWKAAQVREYSITMNARGEEIVTLLTKNRLGDIISRKMLGAPTGVVFDRKLRVILSEDVVRARATASTTLPLEGVMGIQTPAQRKLLAWYDLNTEVVNKTRASDKSSSGLFTRKQQKPFFRTVAHTATLLEDDLAAKFLEAMKKHVVTPPSGLKYWLLHDDHKVYNVMKDEMTRFIRAQLQREGWTPKAIRTVDVGVAKRADNMNYILMHKSLGATSAEVPSGTGAKIYGHSALVVDGKNKIVSAPIDFKKQETHLGALVEQLNEEAGVVIK